MEKRRLGRSELTFAPIVLGGNVFGWTADEAMSLRVLDAFVAAGFSAIDTADTYSRFAPGNTGGESETIIGKWMAARKNRDRVLVFTKVGHEMSRTKKGLSKRYIKAEIEDSLKRLLTNYVDLYQSHRDDPDTPVSETMEAYADLVREGKVRFAGASNFTAARLMESQAVAHAHGWPRYESLQPGYNLYARADFEAELMGVCVREEIGVIPYYGLASGFLTGKYRSESDFGKSPRGARMKAFLNPRGMRILAALDAVAAAHECSQAAVALAWLLTRPSITAPIVSATSPEQVKEFSVAAEMQLKKDEIAALDFASAP
jgi:aryl-alcohol dehydrogenase-like predicted oxidoreductase